MTGRLLRATAALVDAAGVMRPEFYRFFLDLAKQQAGSASGADLASINEQITALQAAINALPESGGYPTLQVLGPLALSGLLQTGFARLSWKGTTSDVPEGSNLYYTDARADARIAAHDKFPFFASDGSAAYIPLTSDLKLPFTASNGSAQNIPLAA